MYNIIFHCIPTCRPMYTWFCRSTAKVCGNIQGALIFANFTPNLPSANSKTRENICDTLCAHFEHVGLVYWPCMLMQIRGVDRSSKVGGGDGFQLVGENARERSDQARGSKATERGEGVGGGGRGCPPSHGREICQFWGSESCNLVHAVMRFFTLYLIRIWI